MIMRPMKESSFCIKIKSLYSRRTFLIPLRYLNCFNQVFNRFTLIKGNVNAPREKRFALFLYNSTPLFIMQHCSGGNIKRPR